MKCKTSCCIFWVCQGVIMITFCNSGYITTKQTTYLTFGFVKTGSCHIILLRNKEVLELIGKGMREVNLLTIKL